MIDDERDRREVSVSHALAVDAGSCNGCCAANRLARGSPEREALTVTIVNLRGWVSRLCAACAARLKALL